VSCTRSFRATIPSTGCKPLSRMGRHATFIGARGVSIMVYRGFIYWSCGKPWSLSLGCTATKKGRGRCQLYAELEVSCPYASHDRSQVASCDCQLKSGERLHLPLLVYILTIPLLVYILTTPHHPCYYCTLLPHTNSRLPTYLSIHITLGRPTDQTQ
jgi:hypothetical protein